MADPDCRAMCAELLEWAERTSSHYYKQADVIVRARALLDQQEPEGPKPMVDYSRVPEIATEAQIRSAAQYLVKKRNCDGDLIPAIEYAIARWGRPTSRLPADGEVAELVAKLCRLAPQNPLGTADPTITRAADLLQRQRFQPVPVSERPWEREGWCDEQGQCWLGDPGGGGADPSWQLTDPRDVGPYHTHSLPANALPTPRLNDLHS
jgi:hypothetical protein